MTGQIFKAVTITSGVSEEVQVPNGFTLSGIDIPEITSASLTITTSLRSGGTFTTYKTPLGIYGLTAGTAITLTVDTTSLGVFALPSDLMRGLLPFIKIVSSASETFGANLIFSNIA